MAPNVGKIATIKVVRSLFSLGLKEAKDIVDGWQHAGKFTKPTNGGA
jgi:ribosomal protein L7/L12